MKKHEPVKHIMSTNLITVAANGSFSAAKNALEENKIHHVPVIDGKKLVGMVSMIDILKYSFSNAFVGEGRSLDAALDHAISLSDIMSDKLTTIDENDTVKSAAQMLSSGDFNCLPVVNSNSELVGMVTTRDIIQYLLEQY